MAQLVLGRVGGIFLLGLLVFLRYVIVKAETWPLGSQQRRKTLVVHPFSLFLRLPPRLCPDIGAAIFSWRDSPSENTRGMPAGRVCVCVHACVLASVNSCVFRACVSMHTAGGRREDCQEKGWFLCQHDLQGCT